MDNEAGRALAAMGYRSVDFSGGWQIDYDALSRKADIRGFGGGIDGAGAVHADAGFDSVAPELFGGSKSAMGLALLGVQLRSAKVRLENAGAAQRLLSWQAAQSGKEAGQVKADWRAFAENGLQRILPAPAARKPVMAAIDAFLAKPASIEFAIDAQPPVVIGTYFLAHKEPAQWLDGLRLTARAR